MSKEKIKEKMVKFTTTSENAIK